ncbi:MAG: hypothetical protein RSE38_05370 [Acinetobacter sp.]
MSAFRYGDTVFQAQPPNLINQSGFIFHPSLANPVQTLNILLPNGFLWHIAHSRTAVSFHNCSSIIFVIFAAHTERGNILWADLFNFMSVLPELT